MNSPDSTNGNSITTTRQFFLPDFCHARSVFMVVLVAELLSLLLSLVSFQAENFWYQLGRYSLVIQWIALLSTALLCLLRPLLRKLSDIKAGIVGYLLVLIVTLIVNLGAIWTEENLRGEIDFQLSQHQNLWSNLLVAAILAAIMLRFFYLQAQYRNRIQIAADAKLQALQARIHPHFLFNSMNIIAGLIPINPDLAEQAIEDLSDLFRASLAEHRSLVSLTSEIDLCKRYLSIEQLRLGDRLKSEWLCATDLSMVSIPPLTIQPLIENAIYHGIQPLVEGGEVKIEISIDKKVCQISIHNPVSTEEVSRSSGNQVAFMNIKERLKMIYEDEASLELNIKDGHCEVVLILPVSGTSNRE